MAKPASTSRPDHRYRARRIQLAEGAILELHGNGTIEHHDPAGEVVEAWRPDDPDWPRHALRFGLRAAPPTVKPSGRDAPTTRPG